MNIETQATAIKQPLRWIGMRMLYVLLGAIVAAGCATSAEPQPSDQREADLGLSQDAPPTGTLEVINVDLNAVPPLHKDMTASESCPKLEGPLRQIVASAEPVKTAQALGLPVREDQVQVMLVLDGTSTAFLDQAGIDVGQQVGPEIQAYVSIPRLCELAAHESVLAIRPVSQAEPQ